MPRCIDSPFDYRLRQRQNIDRGGKANKIAEPCDTSVIIEGLRLVELARIGASVAQSYEHSDSATNPIAVASQCGRSFLDSQELTGWRRKP